MISFANCHFHSLFSDGDFMPEQLVEFAVGAGHKALILTDHDTIRGTYALDRAARKYGILTMVGCEFTTVEGYHMCGFDFNTENVRMRELLERISPMQTARSKLLFEWGQKRGTLRGGLTWQDVLDDFPDNNYYCNNQVRVSVVKRGIYKPEELKEMCRNNFSYRLELEPELAQLIKEATSRLKPTVAEAIEVVKAAGGVPVIAHPIGVRGEKADRLREMGIMGFETHHSDMSDEDEAFFDEYCEKHNLYKCGGTDHCSVMAGIFDREGDPGPESGGMSEEDFMKLYRRELG